MQRVKQWARSRWFGSACGAVALGLLFWARLIVVSDMPRTAIADEEPVPPITDVLPPEDLSDNGAESPNREQDLRDPKKDASHEENDANPSKPSSNGNATDQEKSTGEVTENRK